MSAEIALITGASRGIGAATAQLLGSLGYTICVNYRNGQSEAECVAAAICDRGGSAFSYRADIGDPESVKSMFRNIDQHGSLSVLVNNAGINGGVCSVAELTPQDLALIFATNVFGAFYCCQEAITRMRENGGGSIVNVSSEAARFGGNRVAAYASSKAAINTFTIALAREVAGFDIRVNAVSPGVIDTEIHSQSTPERINGLMQSLPMGRMGQPDEVAEAIAWLVSPAASFVSGSVLPVNGAR